MSTVGHLIKGLVQEFLSSKEERRFPTEGRKWGLLTLSGRFSQLSVMDVNPSRLNTWSNNNN
jgi:hypothetical protein